MKSKYFYWLSTSLNCPECLDKDNKYCGPFSPERLFGQSLALAKKNREEGWHIHRFDRTTLEYLGRAK